MATVASARQCLRPLVPAGLVGTFRVERTAGILPRGFSKRIGADGLGITAFGGVPLFPFRVAVASPAVGTLLYAWLPIRDELVLRDGKWEGRGLVFGIEFCRFNLVPRELPRPPRPI